MMIELPRKGGRVTRGTPVHITIIFSDDPKDLNGNLAVFAQFLRPHESRPVVDPGYDEPGSRIRRLSKGVYSYVIDTTGFETGQAFWKVWGPEEAAEVGDFRVDNDGAPEQLV